ncbi:1,2-phenylacetyl-CoA epoxidase subunit PaaD [Angustibacter sp. McL0619]|uniref:1,2-phenylacetyl-CoA epoxidase subunit PaaD n=1 Tax=Angustibacter sp. McL0619 TaxID=3415676 RepID=UPI003CE771FB
MVTSTLDRASAYTAAAAVLDPEVPVLTIEDLGVLRAVQVAEDGSVDVTITPTYSGCPAMQTIADDVATALAEAGFGPVRVATVLAPAWSTDWMSEDGRRKLSEYGIAPPSPPSPTTGDRRNGPVQLTLGRRPELVACPQCGSTRTRELSRFGSTACKALWQCESCHEPFDHFKAI